MDLMVYSYSSINTMPNFTKNQNLHVFYLKTQIEIACLLYARAVNNDNNSRADELLEEIAELHNILHNKK